MVELPRGESRTRVGLWRVAGGGLVEGKALGLRAVIRVVAASSIAKHVTNVHVVENDLFGASEVEQAGWRDSTSEGLVPCRELSRRPCCRPCHFIKNLGIFPSLLLPGSPTIKVSLVVHTVAELMSNLDNFFNVSSL